MRDFDVDCVSDVVVEIASGKIARDPAQPRIVHTYRTRTLSTIKIMVWSQSVVRCTT